MINLRASSGAVSQLTDFYIYLVCIKINSSDNPTSVFPPTVLTKFLNLSDVSHSSVNFHTSLHFEKKNFFTSNDTCLTLEFTLGRSCLNMNFLNSKENSSFIWFLKHMTKISVIVSVKKCRSTGQKKISRH